MLWGTASFSLWTVRESLAACHASHPFAELPFRCDGPTVFCCGGSGRQRPQTFFPLSSCVNLTLEHALELFSPNAKLAVSNCVQTQFSSHITIQPRIGLLLFHRVREDNGSKWLGFLFLFRQFMGHPLSKPFHVSSLLRCQMATKWSTWPL